MLAQEPRPVEHGLGLHRGLLEARPQLGVLGIPSLRNALSKLNMRLLPLGQASLAHLPENERAAWGRYYDEKPQVMAVKRLPSFGAAA